jgi:hypothetical protein
MRFPDTSWRWWPRPAPGSLARARGDRAALRLDDPRRIADIERGTCCPGTLAHGPSARGSTPVAISLAHGSPSAASASLNASRGSSVRPDIRLVGQHRHGEPSPIVLGERHVDMEGEVGVAETNTGEVHRPHSSSSRGARARGGPWPERSGERCTGSYVHPSLGWQVVTVAGYADVTRSPPSSRRRRTATENADPVIGQRGCVEPGVALVVIALVTIAAVVLGRLRRRR